MKKRILSLLLCGAIITTLLPNISFATEDTIASMERHISVGDVIYYGDYTESGITYDVPWIAINNKGYLFSKHTLGTSKFRDGNGYYAQNEALETSDSLLKTVMDGFYNGDNTLFSSEEKNVIELKQLAAESMESQTEYLTQTKGDNNLNLAYAYGHVYPLSIYEVQTIKSTTGLGMSVVQNPTSITDPDGEAQSYGTRSSYGPYSANDARSIYWIIKKDSTTSTPGDWYFNYQAAIGVRPSMDLNIDSIYYKSAAIGGKAGNVSSTLSAATTDTEISEWKLTVRDFRRNKFEIETPVINGTTVSVSYSGATVGENEYISALIKDNYDKICYYGRVAKVTEESGTATVDLSGIDMSDKRLYLYSEQYNGDKNTDYASDLLPVYVEGSQYTGGMSFCSENLWRTTDTYQEEPMTYEFEIYLPKDFKGGSVGAITGSGNTGAFQYLNVTSTGQLYMLQCPQSANGVAATTYAYDCLWNVNLFTGDWTHVSIVKDVANRKLNCYINGTLAQSKSMPSAAYNADAIESGISYWGDGATMIGGNIHNTTQNSYFKGMIKKVTLYNDARTAEEIGADYVADTPNTDGLIAWYDLSSVSATATTIEDSNVKGEPAATGTDYDLMIPWQNERPAYDDYDYSFAVLGDTQALNRYYNENMNYIFDFLLDNKDSMNIECVVNVGDISDERPAGDSLAHRWTQEWIKAKEQYHRLDNIIPYNVCRGNHDDMERILEYFPVSDYEGKVNGFGGYYRAMYNNYVTFSVGAKDYVLVTIDYGADAEECAWADEVIKAHPNHNAIVVTHSYIYKKGYVTDNAKYEYGALSGEEIWEKVINENPNVTMVLCGHVNGDFITYQRTGANGNIVQEVMVNPQNIDITMEQGAGLVGMLLFSEREDGYLDMQFEYYSTVRRQWYDSRYQLVGTGDDGQALTVNVIENESYPKITGVNRNGIYCESVEVTVTDDDLVSVTLNGTPVTLVNGKFTVGALEGKQTIVATDAANHTTTYQITVNEQHTYGDWIGSEGGIHKRYCELCGVVDSDVHVWDTSLCQAEQLTYKKQYKTTPPICKTEGFLFAGWYKTYENGVFGQTVSQPSEGTSYYAKFVPSDVLTVKCQVTEGTNAQGAPGNTGKTDVRFVTTIDSLNYSSIGFEIIENANTSSEKVWDWSTEEVCETITGDAGAGVYSYSPSFFDAASVYYATVTMNGVKAENFNNIFLITPYWITYDGVKVCGVSRYMRISDSYNGVVNIPVYLNDDTTISAGTTITVTSKMGSSNGLTDDNQLTYQGYDVGTLCSNDDLTVSNNGNVITITVTGTEEINATGFLVNLRYKPKYTWSSMQSRFVFETAGQTADETEVTVLDSEYRNVFGNGIEDVSMCDDKVVVISSPAELRGFAKWSNSQSSFAGRTVKLATDIDLNPGWEAGTTLGTNGKTWTPIGSGTFTYQGIFDGQGHTIKGIYVNDTTLTNVGLFGTLQGTVKNVRLQNSYITGGTNTGSIAGRLERGTLDTVYSDATVYKEGTNVGGMVGKLSYSASNVIRNCWYAGEVCGASNTGGFVGNCDGSGLTIEHCYNTGRVKTKGATGQVGGFIGYVYVTEGKSVLIKDSLSFAGKTGNNVGTAGSIIGYIEAGKGVVTLSNTYGTTNFVDEEISDNYPTTNWSGHLVASALQTVTVDNVQMGTGAIDVNMLHEKQILRQWETSNLEFNLSFDNGGTSKTWWMRTKDGMPMLKSFSDMPFKALKF